MVPRSYAQSQKGIDKKTKNCDVVLEMRDARIPISSVNHDLEELLFKKKRILIFNKTGLADEKITSKWDLIFNKSNIPFLFIDALNKIDLEKILPLARSMMQKRWSYFRQKGILPPPLKLMIVGIPNVGKSSLINRLSKRKAAQIGPNPGVTKHQEWIKLDKNVELLDTPGILWPRIENHEVGLRLTITGAIKDSIVGTSILSIYLLCILKKVEPRKLEKFYQLELSDIGLPPVDLINKIAKKRGCLKTGGIIDLPRAESLLLKDFRSGKLGRLSFDIPEKI